MDIHDIKSIHVICYQNMVLKALMNSVYDASGFVLHCTCLMVIYHYDVAVIQWITSWHKNRMTIRYITLGYWRVTS